MLTFPQKRGEFTLLRKIGEGGMAEVFLAEREGDEDFKTLVALKRLHGGFALDQYFIRQLVQEAKLLGQLQHTNIVRVSDLRRIDDDYYIVMEYIDGIDVAQAIQVHRDNDLRFPLSIFFHIALSLCEALDFAHSATNMDGKPIRLIHRDIKPSNVLISNRGIVKLTDFGIARVGDTSNTGSVVKGTANYMSPEQASGEQNLTPASDIFSLGAVFWEMLTLEKLVDGSNYLTVINSIKDLNVGLKDITKKGIEPGLRMILLRMLARKRELRYQSMGLVLKDLRFVAEQMKVDLSPSHLREYMAKITQLARDAAGKVAAGTNLATATAELSSVDTGGPENISVDRPSEPVSEEPVGAPAPEAAFLESVAALKALVQKPGGAPVASPPPPPPPGEVAHPQSGGIPTAPPRAPLPRSESHQANVPEELSAPPSAVGLHAISQLAEVSSEDELATERSSPSESSVPTQAGKRSRKQKKKDRRKVGAAVPKGAPGGVGSVEVPEGAVGPISTASSGPIPPAGVPTPPMKRREPVAPQPLPVPSPPVVARSAPPPVAAPPEPVMTAVADVSHNEGYDGYDEDDDYDDWDSGGSNRFVWALGAIVLVLMVVVILLMIPEDTGEGVVATDPLSGQEEPGTEVAEIGSPDEAPGTGASDEDSGSEAVADRGSLEVAASSQGVTSTDAGEREKPLPRRSVIDDRTSDSSRSGRSSSQGSGRDGGKSSPTTGRATASSSRRSPSSRTGSSADAAVSSNRTARSASPTSDSPRPERSSTSPRYTGGSSSSSRRGSESASLSSSNEGSSSAPIGSRSDVRSPYDDEEPLVSDEADEAVAVVDGPEAEQILDDYSDMARRGRLGSSEIDTLQGIAPGAASYEPSRAVLLAQYEAVGDRIGHCNVAGEVLAQPGNYADPQWNLEMSKCHLREGRFEDALQSSRVAELHAQDIPARSRTDRQLKIWEIQAKSYKGLYQSTENLDYLSDAIAVWKRYRHMANNTYRPREATQADEAIVALQDLSEGSL